MKIFYKAQGERRFFKVCMRWLANERPEAARRNLQAIPEYGRWDDLYCLVGTPLEAEMFDFLKGQLYLDMKCETPSLLAKWLKSENASSKETKILGHRTREAFGLSHKDYRKTLSILRKKINIVERLMSENRWDEIEFDKIPSKAGLIYKNAFARRDIIAAKYEAFAKDKTTKVNAEVLNPVDIANKIYGNDYWRTPNLSDTDVAMLQKYWDNLKDYYNGRQENGLAIIDTSGSMYGQPLNAAVSMGAYIAERGHGPFANHFITFSSEPELVKFEGVNIVDKFLRAREADWGMNTNLKAVFNLLLDTALRHHTDPKDIPETLYIFSDMEFDGALSNNYRKRATYHKTNTLLEDIAEEWKEHGYELPRVIFWNLNARQQNVPALGSRFSYISGFSMVMIEGVLSGKDGLDLCLEKLNSSRYAPIH